MRIKGIHGRNEAAWTLPDYEAIELVQPGWLKMIGYNRWAGELEALVNTFEHIRQVVPGVRFVTRLYDGSNFGSGHHPGPAEFVNNMTPVIEALSPYCSLYEIHNEPNHCGTVEGWGHTEQYANNFTGWLMLVLNLLKTRFPDARWGFPGLATPHFIHNDRGWLQVCRPAIMSCDFLCCHSYWQSPPGDPKQYWLNGDFGLNFKYYHSLYPDKPIYITEAGNSNCQNGYPLSGDEMAAQLVAWYRVVESYDYVIAACPYLLSSPDKEWGGFAWVDEDSGRLKPVCHEVAEL